MELFWPVIIIYDFVSLLAAGAPEIQDPAVL
jgi:hypothetical protein